MSNTLIKLESVESAHLQKPTSKPINFELCEGEHIALLGDNGAGKTIIAEIIMGGCALRAGKATYEMGNDKARYENIASVTFRTQYDSPDFFFQQRWNSTAYDECPTLKEVTAQFEYPKQLASILKIDELMERRVIELSSGELRRFTLFKALASQPRVLMVDNLYVGLDEAMRHDLNEAILRLSEDNTVSIISICSKERDIPPCTTHIYNVANMALGEKELYEIKELAPQQSYFSEKSEGIDRNSGGSIINFESINISYGKSTLFKDFAWQVNQGERWLLTGGNGSGKTTLLSLVTGDNPQAYAQKISLFGRKRGTGESIWDIKRKIGFLSPEMLRGYMVNVEAVNIVASGFFDCVGLFHIPNDEQLEKSLVCMKEFGIEHIAHKSFVKLSSGEQRMVLAARAFVKNPELMILDEPFHDLDNRNSKIIAEKIVSYAKDPLKTIIYVSHYPADIPPITTNHLHLEKKR